VQNERNSFYGKEVREKEHDCLQAMRQKDLPSLKEEMQFLRIRKISQG